MENQQQGPASPAGGQQIKIKVPDEVLKGVYSNMMQASHTPEEFILDFMNIVGVTGVLASRVIVSPGHMKRIVGALQENLKKFEEQFGAIKVTDAPTNNFGFRTE